MPSDLDQQLARWSTAGLIDAATADRIRAYELENRPAHGLDWQVRLLLAFGAAFVFAGIVLFFAAHWESTGPIARMALALSLIALLHLAGAAAAPRFPYLSTALHAIATLTCAAAIAIIGQAFNLDGNWPGAIVLWALCAIAGWALLRDPVQQTIALLLIPAAIIAEWSFYAAGYRGDSLVLRLTGAAAILLFLYAARSSSKFLSVALGSASAIVLLFTLLALDSASHADLSYYTHASPLPWLLVSTNWILFCILPLTVALLWHRRQTLVPIVTVVSSLIVLSHLHVWKNTVWANDNPLGYLWNALLAAAAIAWGARRVTPAFVNFGMALFAINAFIFFFSNIFDKLGRSASFLVTGVLLIGGGILMERLRRRIIRNLAPHSGSVSNTGQPPDSSEARP